VVAGDRDRVPLRDVLAAVGEQVGCQPHCRNGRVDEVPARDVLLEDVVLGGAAQDLRGNALLLADELVEQQENRSRSVDGHRRGHLVQRNLVEHAAHVLDGVDGHAGAADLAQAEGVVRVPAQLRRQVERHRQTGGAVLEQIAEALVGLGCRRVTRVLAHGPGAAAVHVLADASGERVMTRLAEALGQALSDV
jgi:hypothetical protein